MESRPLGPLAVSEYDGSILLLPANQVVAVR
jgi:hypothetical protein